MKQSPHLTIRLHILKEVMTIPQHLIRQLCRQMLLHLETIPLQIHQITQTGIRITVLLITHLVVHPSTTTAHTGGIVRALMMVQHGKIDHDQTPILLGGVDEHVCRHLVT